MTEKRYTVEMAIYKRREGSSNIGVNYIHDNYSKNNKMVKCCGRNYVDVEVPESAIVFGDTNRHIVNKVCERLNDLNNENEQLKETIKELELENVKHIGDGEWDIRDITYGHGKFRLEEWGERYHQFYDGDKALEDEEVVSLLFENEQLKNKCENYKQALLDLGINVNILDGTGDD